MIPTLPKSSDRRWYAAPPRDESPPTRWFLVVAIASVVTWLVLTGWIVTHTSTVGSPDEAANQLFTQHLATTDSYRISTGLTAAQTAVIHPRSVAVQGSDLLPGSFLGLVQAGALMAKVFGLGAERFLTPLLTLVALVALYLIFRRFWGRWWALLGVTLLAIHPVFFEFATLPYLHNGAFAAMLVVAGWCLLRLLEQSSPGRSLLFGLAYGLALFFRPVEVLWTGPIVAVILLVRPGGWRWLGLAAAATLTCQIPWLLVNHQLFGSWLSSGYTPSGVFSDAAGLSAVATPVMRLFTPPGGQWSWHWLSSTWWFLILLLPTWSVMAVVSLGVYFRRKYTTPSKALKLSLISLLGVFPLVYYGTWNLYPQIPAAKIGALASYARYWLPLYVAMTPGVILVLRRITPRWLLVGVVGMMVVSQLTVIITQPVSGLQARFAADRQARQRRQFMLGQTPVSAVIVAGSQDKYLYDARLTIFALPSTKTSWSIFQQLVQARPVFLLAAPNQYNLPQLIDQLTIQHLQLSDEVTVNRDQLWRITRL